MQPDRFRDFFHGICNCYRKAFFYVPSSKSKPAHFANNPDFSPFSHLDQLSSFQFLSANLFFARSSWFSSIFSKLTFLECLKVDQKLDFPRFFGSFVLQINFAATIPPECDLTRYFCFISPNFCILWKGTYLISRVNLFRPVCRSVVFLSNASRLKKTRPILTNLHVEECFKLQPCIESTSLN